MTRRDIPTWLPVLLLGAVLFTLFHRLLSGQALFWGLPALQFFPWRHYAFQLLADGHLPIWNPYVGAGAPLLANLQTAVFYPPNWFFLPLPDPLAMSLIAVAHLLWAGVGMWLFTGVLGISRFGRSVSMLSYALSGYLIARVGSFPTMNTAAWIPWIFWLAHRVTIGRRMRDAGWLSLAVGLQVLAGHAQTAFYSALGVSLYVLWRVLWDMRSRSRRQRWSGALMVLASMLLGLAIAAVQIVPTAEYLQQSQRSSGLDYTLTSNLSYNPFRLLTLFSPNFYGTPADGSYVTKGIFFEDAAYIGFIPVVSAMAALAGWFRKRRFLMHYPAFQTVPFWASLALAALVIAVGRNGPIFRLLYDYVPTFDFFREPVRWLILTVFSLSVLAGIGTHHWGRSKSVVFWSRLAAAGGGALGVMALVTQQVVEQSSREVEVLTAGMIVLGCWMAAAALLTLTKPTGDSPITMQLWQVAVLAFVAIDLGWAATGLNPTVSSDFYRDFGVTRPQGRIYWFEDYEREVKFEHLFDLSDYRKATDQWPDVRTSQLPNLNMLDRVPALNNFDPLLPRYHRRYIELIEALGENATQLLRVAGVSQVYGTQPAGWDEQTPLFGPSRESGLAWLVPQAAWIDSEPALEEALSDPAWDPAQTVFLAGNSPAEDSTSAMIEGSITVLENSATRLRYRIRSDGPAYLVVSVTWYPGWQATLDGRQVPTYRANLAFQAIAVPPGETDVTLSYHLNNWPMGAGITVGAALVAFGLVVLGSLALSRDPFRRIPPPPD